MPRMIILAGFDLRPMWTQMGAPAKAVMALLAIMFAWSVSIVIDRFIVFSQIGKQSREFAAAVVRWLEEGKVEEAIAVAEQNKASHLALVVEAGLQEFRDDLDLVKGTGERIESSRRACVRAEAIVQLELKRGVSGLATIGATAPFVGLFGTTIGIINAFASMASKKVSGLAAVSNGISEALITTAFGLFVAVPAVWAYNWFTHRIASVGLEITHTSSALIDCLIRKKGPG